MRRSISSATCCLLACLAMACGSDRAEDGGYDGPGLMPPPSRGLQLNMVTDIEAGSEVEHCQFFQIPEGEDLWVTSAPIAYSAGSHHVLVYRTEYSEVPTENKRGEAEDFSGVWDCSDGIQSHIRTGDVLAGSQNPRGDSMLSFPEGVAMNVSAGTWVVVNAHYLNTSAEALTPQVTINLETIPESDVEIEGGLFFWYNMLILVPGMSSAKARTSCEMNQDVFLTTAQSHMHRRGVGYVAQHFESGGGEGKTIYENPNWDNVPIRTYGDGLALKAGDTLEYECSYQNSENHDVFQGPRASDEMCMFLGTYYPRVPSLDNCSTDSGRSMLGMDWIGSGDATCAETLTCASGALAGGGTDAVAGCIYEADPAVSKTVSAALRCVLENGTSNLDKCSAEFADCQAN